MSVSYSVDVLSGVVVDELINVLAGLPAGVTSCVVLGIGVEVLADMNVNVLAAAMTALEFVMSMS